MGNNDDERLRMKPSDRFEGDLHKFDLGAELKRIQSEDLSEEHLRQGHRQIELQRHKGTTVTLYHFEADGEIPEHTLADGLVVLHVLHGEINVSTNQGDRTVSENELLTIKSDLAHSLRATQESQCLLTIAQ